MEESLTTAELIVLWKQRRRRLASTRRRKSEELFRWEISWRRSTETKVAGNKQGCSCWWKGRTVKISHDVGIKSHQWFWTALIFRNTLNTNRASKKKEEKVLFVSTTKHCIVSGCVQRNRQQQEHAKASSTAWTGSMRVKRKVPEPFSVKTITQTIGIMYKCDSSD